MTDFELSRLFLAIFSLLGMAHGCGYAFERYRMPRVIGEIFGGIVLGPSVLGLFFPALYQGVFRAFPSEADILSFLYWMGLVALMFTSGFHIQRKVERRDLRIALTVLISATVFPFLIGWHVPDLFDFSSYVGKNANDTSLRLVAAIAFSVTSIPVISKIFMDLGIMGSRFARIVLTVATIQDLILWLALSIATDMTKEASPDTWFLVFSAAKTLLFVGIALWSGPRLLTWISSLRFNLVIKASSIGYLFVICFLFAAFGSFLSINLVFGALIAGIIVGTMKGDRFEAEKARIKDFSSGLFIPLYFSLVGLGIDLPNHFDPVFTLIFIVASSAVSIIFVTVGTRLRVRSKTSCINFAMAMNTRGGPGIVLASIAFEYGIINDSFYIALVISAIVTSLISGMWFRWLTVQGRPLLEDA